MAGRDYLPPNALKFREVPLPRGAFPPPPIDDPRLLNRLPLSIPANPVTLRPNHISTILQDRISLQHRDIQSLLLENQRLAAAYGPLKQELALVQQDLRILSVTAADVKVERDNVVREVYERSLKKDAELRSIEVISVELAQVRKDIQKLTLQRQELNEELQAINDDLAKARTEAELVPSIKAEIENLQQEIKKGRAAIECEKKTRAINLKHEQAMERNMIVLAREIENLHAELANADGRARAAAAAAAAANPSPGCAGSYCNPEVGYVGIPYPDRYGVYHVQSNVDGGPPVMSGAMPKAIYDKQQTHLHG